MSDQSLEIQRLREELARLSGEVETLRAERAEMKSANEKLLAEKEEMQQVINDLRSMMAWFRKKLFYKMSEKNLPLDPNVLEPTLFDQALSEEEQARLDAEVKAMEERNAKAIEVKAHKREIRKPVLSGSLPIEETHIYPEGVQGNPEYVEIGVQTDGYEVYESFENAPGKRMIGCWAHVRRKFVEALDENKKYASEAIVYIGKLYKIEAEMREAGLSAEEERERRQKESYPLIQEFEKWMDAVADKFKPKSRMGKALVYTYTLHPRLSRYVLDGRYNIDNNGIENAIRPLALGRKNYLFVGNHDAAVCAAIVYSLFSSCKAAGIEARAWLEDILVRLPGHNGDLGCLLPGNWRK